MYQYKAKCVNVVDGDTMDFDVDLGFYMTKRIRVRLADIDCPEIFGKDAKVEGELGKKVKQYVEYLLMPLNMESEEIEHIPTDVVVATEKTGSFGRWIATITFTNGQTLSNKIKETFPEIE